MSVEKYRKKPIVIEAIQWIGKKECLEEIIVFAGTKKVVYDFVENRIGIPTLEGTMYANIGDYIIRGIKGELYPCKPDIFMATYEKTRNDNEYE